MLNCHVAIAAQPPPLDDNNSTSNNNDDDDVDMAEQIMFDLNTMPSVDAVPVMDGELQVLPTNQDHQVRSDTRDAIAAAARTDSTGLQRRGAPLDDAHLVQSDRPTFKDQVRDENDAQTT